MATVRVRVDAKIWGMLQAIRIPAEYYSHTEKMFVPTYVHLDQIGSVRGPPRLQREGKPVVFSPSSIAVASDLLGPFGPRFSLSINERCPPPVRSVVTQKQPLMGGGTKEESSNKRKNVPRRGEGKGEKKMKEAEIEVIDLTTGDDDNSPIPPSHHHADILRALTASPPRSILLPLLHFAPPTIGIQKGPLSSLFDLLEDWEVLHVARIDKAVYRIYYPSLRLSNTLYTFGITSFSVDADTKALVSHLPRFRCDNVAVPLESLTDVEYYMRDMDRKARPQREFVLTAEEEEEYPHLSPPTPLTAQDKNAIRFWLGVRTLRISDLMSVNLATLLRSTSLLKNVNKVVFLFEDRLYVPGDIKRSGRKLVPLFQQQTREDVMNIRTLVIGEIDENFVADLDVVFTNPHLESFALGLVARTRGRNLFLPAPNTTYSTLVHRLHVGGLTSLSLMRAGLTPAVLLTLIHAVHEDQQRPHPSLTSLDLQGNILNDQAVVGTLADCIDAATTLRYLYLGPDCGLESESKDNLRLGPSLRRNQSLEAISFCDGFHNNLTFLPSILLSGDLPPSRWKELNLHGYYSEWVDERNWFQLSQQFPLLEKLDLGRHVTYPHNDRTDSMHLDRFTQLRHLSLHGLMSNDDFGDLGPLTHAFTVLVHLQSLDLGKCKFISPLEVLKDFFRSLSHIRDIDLSRAEALPIEEDVDYDTGDVSWTAIHPSIADLSWVPPFAIRSPMGFENRSVLYYLLPVLMHKHCRIQTLRLTKLDNESDDTTYDHWTEVLLCLIGMNSLPSLRQLDFYAVFYVASRTLQYLQMVLSQNMTLQELFLSIDGRELDQVETMLHALFEHPKSHLQILHIDIRTNLPISTTSVKTLWESLRSTHRFKQITLMFTDHFTNQRVCHVPSGNPVARFSNQPRYSPQRDAFMFDYAH